MTRRLVYGIGLAGFLAALALTLASIAIPEWLVYSTDLPTQPKHTYGLHTRCSSTSHGLRCSPFPTYDDCRRRSTAFSSDPSFCALWRTASFLLSFSVVIQLATTVAFAVLLLGGKQKRVRGWKILCALLGTAAALQLVAVVVYAVLGMREERFKDGWVVGKSWGLALGSVVSMTAVVAGTIWAKFSIEEEGGYEIIADRDVDR